jgi:hypothetical protein
MARWRQGQQRAKHAVSARLSRTQLSRIHAAPQRTYRYEDDPRRHRTVSERAGGCIPAAGYARPNGGLPQVYETNLWEVHRSSDRYLSNIISIKE